MHGSTEAGDVDFDCWWLERGVYEGAAREGGLSGEMRWGGTRVPEGWLQGEGGWPGGAGREEVESYERVPGYGVLVVEK